MRVKDFDKSKVRLETTTLPDVNTGKPKTVYTVWYDKKLLGIRHTLLGAKKLARMPV